MPKIKRLYLFMLQGFLPLFSMTFFICLFIVLMQFLWRYIDELVGKGLDISVIAELFFYAALTMVPMALPLAILLASLMLFGNLGERFELTAMKSSGISLLKVMSPLIVFISMVSVGAFFFQNDVLPKAQVKMWTLLFSMRQKSPELDIPEGAFYDQIPGYNLYVEKKDRDNGMLYDVKIYDMSKGFGNASIILSDSAKMSFTSDKQNLFLQLWQGESFENLKEQQIAHSGVPYRRESFTNKEIMIPFDSNFNRMDDKGMRSQYIGKNIHELQHSIDSINGRIDSIGGAYGKYLQELNYVGIEPYKRVLVDGKAKMVENPPVVLTQAVNVDSIFNGQSLRERQNFVAYALDRSRQTLSEFEFKSYSLKDDKKIKIRHQIELQRKFTLSFACLIFFFIGAPLGAIIRKGGLGMPIVISVFLFIFYYIIDTAGYKMSREGRIEVWQGIWASSAVLLPLGIFLTYKAVNDSAVFKPEVYIEWFKRITGKTMLRHIEMKELIMDNIDNGVAIEKIEHLKASCAEFLNQYKNKLSYKAYWHKGIDKHKLAELSAELEETVEYMKNSDSQLVINKLMDYPILKSLLFYHPVNNQIIASVIMVIFPIGLLGYYIGIKQQSALKKEIKTIDSVSDEIIKILSEIK